MCVKYGKYFSYSCTFVCILEFWRGGFYFFWVSQTKLKSFRRLCFYYNQIGQGVQYCECYKLIIKCSIEIIKVFKIYLGYVFSCLNYLHFYLNFATISMIYIMFKSIYIVSL